MIQVKMSKSNPWDHFILQDKKGICKICETSISMAFSTSTSNLKRHLLLKHPNLITDTEYGEVVENILLSEEVIDDTVVTELPARTEVVETEDLMEDMPKRKSRKLTSSLWEYFTLRNKKGICKLCSTQLSYSGRSSNLRRHLVIKHPHLPLDDNVRIRRNTAHEEYNSDVQNIISVENLSHDYCTTKPEIVQTEETVPAHIPVSYSTQPIQPHTKNVEKTTDVDYFASMLATKLKSLKSARRRINLQVDIMKLLAVAELGDLEEGMPGNIKIQDPLTDSDE